MKPILGVARQLLDFAIAERFGFKPLVETEPDLWGAEIVEEDLPLHTSTMATGESFFVAVPEMLLRLEPVRSFDNVVATLSYGTRVAELQTSENGAWIHVRHGNDEGWVLKEHVTLHLLPLSPRFRNGVRYDAQHADTMKLRMMIKDPFQLVELDAALTDVEYVTYRLHARNAAIPWPPTRPRVAGSWHKILRGIRGVHIGVVPRVESIMEYVDADGLWHVSYVEAVFPDQSIHTAEVGYPGEGLYAERTLLPDTWRERRPLFISIR